MLKNKNIVLIGLMGCGKTTVAKMLSQKLNKKMIDIDEYIVNKYQMTIPEMFDVSETYFRERETICCKEIAKLHNYIVSTGGGVISHSENIKALKENGIIIYIDRPVDLIYQDVDTSSRPLLKDGPDKLYELYAQRHQKYLEACDYHMMNTSSLDDLILQIIEIIEK